MRRDLVEITRKLSLRKALKLLEVYNEVVGAFHPIVDTAALTPLLELLYSGCESVPQNGGSVTDQNLDILSLVLSTALFAQNVSSEARVGRRIFQGCQEAMNCRLLSTPANLDHVVLTLMTVSRTMQVPIQMPLLTCDASLAGHLLFF